MWTYGEKTSKGHLMPDVSFVGFAWLKDKHVVVVRVIYCFNGLFPLAC